jgi:hypothetical protein
VRLVKFQAKVNECERFFLSLAFPQAAIFLPH